MVSPRTEFEYNLMSAIWTIGENFSQCSKLIEVIGKCVLNLSEEFFYVHSAFLFG